MHPIFSSPICFAENRVQVLTIEHAPTFRSLVLELTAQAEGGGGQFVLSRDYTPLDCASSLHVVADYAHIAAPDKRLQNRLLTALLREAQEELAEETMLLTRDVQRYLGRLAALADYPVAYEQSENLTALLKAMDFRISLEDLPIPEALYEHLALHQRLMKHACLVLVHAKAYFSADELAQLYTMAQYQKWNLLLLESDAGRPRLPQEDHRLIDGDLCELILEKPDQSL